MPSKETKRQLALILRLIGETLSAEKTAGFRANFNFEGEDYRLVVEKVKEK